MARDHGWRTNIHLNRQRSRFVSPLEWPICGYQWNDGYLDGTYESDVAGDGELIPERDVHTLDLALACRRRPGARPVNVNVEGVTQSRTIAQCCKAVRWRN
eukprot:scaffold183549_cov33-Tisochrysis_lutea.AAC.2